MLKGRISIWLVVVQAAKVVSGFEASGELSGVVGTPHLDSCSAAVSTCRSPAIWPLLSSPTQVGKVRLNCRRLPRVSAYLRRPLPEVNWTGLLSWHRAGMDGRH